MKVKFFDFDKINNETGVFKQITFVIYYLLDNTKI